MVRLLKLTELFAYVNKLTIFHLDVVQYNKKLHHERIQITISAPNYFNSYHRKILITSAIGSKRETRCSALHLIRNYCDYDNCIHLYINTILKKTTHELII